MLSLIEALAISTSSNTAGPCSAGERSLFGKVGVNPDVGHLQSLELPEFP